MTMLCYRCAVLLIWSAQRHASAGDGVLAALNLLGARRFILMAAPQASDG